MFEIIEIDKNKFENLSNAEKIFGSNDSKYFYLVEGSNARFGFGWDAVIEPDKKDTKPVFLQFDGLLVIGTYDNVFVVSLLEGTIKFAIGLYEALLGIEKTDTGFVAITELEIIAVNTDYFVISTFNLCADIVKKYSLDGKVLKIRSVGDEIYTYTIC